MATVEFEFNRRYSGNFYDVAYQLSKDVYDTKAFIKYHSDVFVNLHNELEEKLSDSVCIEVNVTNHIAYMIIRMTNDEYFDGVLIKEIEKIIGKNLPSAKKIYEEDYSNYFSIS